MASLTSKSVDIVKPVVAGQFYPSDPEELLRDVRRYIEEADIEPAQESVFAILSPHAGYVFSGPVAGYSYRYVQNQRPDTILILALSHRHAIDGGCVFSGHSFATPLGCIDVDEEFTQALLKQGKPLYSDATPYLTEHSIEVNLPFIQWIFPRARVATILTSHADESLCHQLGMQIVSALTQFPQKRVLLVVSSDMSHYPPYEIANRIDREMLESVEKLDPSVIFLNLNRLGNDPTHNVHCVMCGGTAMLVAVEAARALGFTVARTLCYRNSGDSSFGESHRVVGYGSLAIMAAGSNRDGRIAENEGKVDTFALTDQDKRILLEIARKSINAVLNKEIFEPVIPYPHLKIKTGIFVTLKQQGLLRGCLGRFEPGDMNLDQLVAIMAAQSATHDIRFKPVTLEELPMIDIQISVLTPLERVKDIQEIEIGKHGLQVQGRNSFGIMRSGTLLPQVATEQKWGIQEFLEATCVKAGLDSECWKDSKTEIWKYGAVVFGELDYNAPPYLLVSS